MTAVLDMTIIVPNYNTKDLLRQCFRSIFQHTTGISYEVICIDDNSNDGSADMVAHEFPQVVLVRNKVGMMYAKNNNLGMKMARGRYACLLNSDTMIKANAFGALVKYMDAHSEAAACTPKLLNPDGSIQSSVRRFPGLSVLILQGLNWHKVFPHGKVARDYYACNLDHNKAQEIEAVGSTALVLRRSTWETLGMLDERFPLFQVDLAYCYNMLIKGYKLHYTPCAEVIHFGSQSVNKHPKKSLKQIHKGFHDFNVHYDYFARNWIVKFLVGLAIELRYYLKLAEYYLSSDKRVNNGPGRAKLADVRADSDK